MFSIIFHKCNLLKIIKIYSKILSKEKITNLQFCKVFFIYIKLSILLVLKINVLIYRNYILSYIIVIKKLKDRKK